MGNNWGYNYESSPIGWLKTRAGSAVLQYADSIGILPAQQFREKAVLTLFKLFKTNAQKCFPITPPGFRQKALVHIGLLEYDLKFDKNCSLPKKTTIKYGSGKKNFFTIETIFFSCFYCHIF
jgi:hypothetical protein